MGLDKRLIAPTLAILFLQILLAGVIPAVNNATEADDFAPGTVLPLAKGAVTFVPAEGWATAGVALPSTPEVSIFHEGVTFTIATGDFDGTPEELLDEVVDEYRGDFKISGDPQSFTLAQGLPGAGTNIQTDEGDGLVLAFVSDTPGQYGADRRRSVTVRVQGPSNIALKDSAEDVAAMIESIRVGEGTE